MPSESWCDVDKTCERMSLGFGNSSLGLEDLKFCCAFRAEHNEQEFRARCCCVCLLCAVFFSSSKVAVRLVVWDVLDSMSNTRFRLSSVFSFVCSVVWNVFCGFAYCAVVYGSACDEVIPSWIGFVVFGVGNDG